MTSDPGKPAVRRVLQPRSTASAKPGFTLIELLSVVAVLVILAALVGVAVNAALRQSRIRTTYQQIALLENGLERFHVATGCYPQGIDHDGLIVYMALNGDGVGPDGVAGTPDDEAPDGKPDPGRTVFLSGLDPDVNSLRMVEPSGPGATPARLVDPFGQPYRYAGGKNIPERNPAPELWSAGPDGRWNTADDIRN
ncbi:MAG: prepilin-type N-terminal cleavage/methylation domain-containing protein [Akkermansiaceae bacterium]|nr:prepilin-type N-terminal cleavage/methylation domain-containing protein [Akkermansiaceae bacterium]